MSLYKLRYLPLILGLLSLVSGIIIRFVIEAGTNVLFFGLLFTIVGIIFLQAMRQLHKEKLNQLKAPLTIKLVKPTRITIPGFDDECPEIVLTNEYTLLLFNFFPPEHEKLTKIVTNNFVNDLSSFIGNEVIHEDRELFRINSNDPQIVNQLLVFFASTNEKEIN